MGKTNWKRVFLGGLLAGVVLNILNFAALGIYLRKIFDPVLAALGCPVQETIGFQTFWIVFHFVLGIIAVWLYSAIRPRYGAGAKTALVVGLSIWILCPLSFDVLLGAFGLFPANVLVADASTTLVMFVVATLAGAWVYKEQE